MLGARQCFAFIWYQWIRSLWSSISLNGGYFKMFIIKWYQLSQNQIINLTWFDYVPSHLRWKLLIHIDRPGTIARMFIAACNTLQWRNSLFSIQACSQSLKIQTLHYYTKKAKYTWYIKKMIHHIAICKVHALTPTKASAIWHHVHKKFTSS